MAAASRTYSIALAPDNPHGRSLAAFAVSITISPTTVAKILKGYGIEPAPDRKCRTTWKTFIKAHWQVLASIDFTTIETWTTRGLVTFYLLFVGRVDGQGLQAVYHGQDSVLQRITD